VAPILQRLIASAIGVLLRCLLLSQMTLVVGSNTSHMVDIFIAVFRRVLLRVLFQDLDDLAAAGLVSVQAHKQTRNTSPFVANTLS